MTCLFSQFPSHSARVACGGRCPFQLFIHLQRGQRGRAESLPGMFALLSSFRALERHSWAFTASEVHINQNHFTMSNIYVTEIQFKTHKNQSKLVVLQSAGDTVGVWLAQMPLSKNDVALMRWRERCRWGPQPPLLMDTVCSNKGLKWSLACWWKRTDQLI